MQDRRGVILLMFDVPVTDAEQRREYTAFRKQLKHAGFTQLQRSVYVKLMRNMDSLSGEMGRIKSILPSGGEVGVLPMTLSAFKTYTALKGPAFDFSLFSDDLVFIGD